MRWLTASISAASASPATVRASDHNTQPRPKGRTRLALSQLSRSMRALVTAANRKIGRPVAEEDDVFLLSYYRQLKARLERGLLFGKRREDKYASE